MRIQPVRILVGDVIDGLRSLPDASVHCCVTSPPYWGLRDYGVDGQIGLESSPDAYVSKMVAVFREVRRVLRDDGTLWLNLGDSYASNTKSDERTSEQRSRSSTLGPNRDGLGGTNKAHVSVSFGTRRMTLTDQLKPKDLCMIPWRVALALQADGWYLRSVIVWAKKSPMPESVTDRPTSSWEPIFLFAKGQHSTRTIQFTNLEPEFVHFSRYIGEHSSNMGTSAACVRIATAIFDATQEKNDFCLPPFYAKEWNKCLDGSDSNFVTSLPPNHRLAAYAARLLCGHTSTKEFLCKLHGSGVNLADAEHLLIRRRLVECADSPRVLVNGDGTIAVHDSGEIRKINLVHGEIVVTVPTICKYFYDAEAVKESSTTPAHAPGYVNGAEYAVGPMDRGGHSQREQPDRVWGGSGRNQRNVWHLGPEPYKEAHFATFPTEIPRRAIKAGTSEKGCCPACGAPWSRVIARQQIKRERPNDYTKRTGEDGTGNSCANSVAGVESRTVGWEPSCQCNAGSPVPCVVLDPFIGSGTTIAVARTLGRYGVGCELNPEYAELARVRIGKAERPHTFADHRPKGDAPLFVPEELLEGWANNGAVNKGKGT